MKVAELFIGAYVLLPDNRVGKVVFIDVCGNVIAQTQEGDSQPYLVKELKPIIFTPDFFIRNEFVEVKENGIERMRYERKGIKIVWVYLFKGGMDNSWQIYNAEDGTILNTRRIEYVHELQRMLIDCGLAEIGLNFRITEYGKE